MVRRTTPRRRPDTTRRSSSSRRSGQRRKPAGRARAGARSPNQPSTRNEDIAKFHKKSSGGAEQAPDNNKKIKKSNTLKVFSWAAAVVLLAVPTVLIGGSMIGDWFGKNKAVDLETAASHRTLSILPLQPYDVPLNRKSSIRIEPYIELTKAEAVQTVCHYMPRYKAAIIGVLNLHYAKGDPSSVDTNIVILQLQSEIKQSVSLKEIRAVHVKASTVDNEKNTPATSNAFQASQMVQCP